MRRVAGVLAHELQWSEQRMAREIEAFSQEARAEGIVVQPAGDEVAVGRGA